MTDKERLDAQERAIQMIAYYTNNADSGFKVYVLERIQSWGDTTDRNDNTSEEEKANHRKFHEEILRLLLPGKQTVG
ncbi:hypothetical protein [Methylobacterium sp. AMS5]|uniref:hypothetical protein n=1 Tax=Methylobacterium sp. AMS5 TaxID=925818 RepID=UPI00074F99D1|nr:hypothetical protein [Methylobacterium sp. AMS5]AMB48227.1 hypothetical protein Y590_24985 [Methylobacterium sp. AMS5]